METVTVDELEDMKCGICFENFSDETTHPCLVASAELYVTEENYVIPIERRHSSRIAAKQKRRYDEMEVGNNSSDSDDEIPVRRKQRTHIDDGDDNENTEQEK
ncbi:hypothetical protein B566_EDAN016099, partial [Ephemera danica]